MAFKFEKREEYLALCASHVELLFALKESQSVINTLMDKCDMGKAFLNAADITLINEVPIRAHAAIEKAESLTKSEVTTRLDALHEATEQFADAVKKGARP